MSLSSRNIKAVILAAGRGSRIKQHLPKSLLPLGVTSLEDPTPTTFIERQIHCLRLCGVNQIAVVVGHQQELFRDQLKDTSITFVENTTRDISDSGSLHSFQFAGTHTFNALDGICHTLLLDADIVYEMRLLSHFISTLQQTSLLVTSRLSKDSEEVRVYGTGSRPVLIGKGLSSPIIDCLTCLGEAIGIVHFAPSDHRVVKEMINWLVGDPFAEAHSPRAKGFSPAKMKTEHEELSGMLMRLEKISAHIMSAEYLFMEVDFTHEYETAKNELYPKILAADSAFTPS